MGFKGSTTLKWQRLGCGGGEGQPHFPEGPQFPQLLKELCAPKDGHPSSDLLFKVQPRHQQPPELEGSRAPCGPTEWNPLMTGAQKDPDNQLMLESTARTLSEHDGVITGLTVTLTKQTPPRAI